VRERHRLALSGGKDITRRDGQDHRDGEKEKRGYEAKHGYTFFLRIRQPLSLTEINR